MDLKKLICYLLFVVSFLFTAKAKADSLAELPVAYKGRYRPMEAYARLWLDEIYQEQQLPNESALELLWSLNFFGHGFLDETPLFSIRNRELKHLLQLDSSERHFSYSQLTKILLKDNQKSLPLLKRLLIYHFSLKFSDPFNHFKVQKFEMSPLAPGLWIGLKGRQLEIEAVPIIAPWNFFQLGHVLENQFVPNKKDKKLSEDSLALFNTLSQYSQINGAEPLEQNPYETYVRELTQQKKTPKEISYILEGQFPLKQRLAQAGTLFRMLPSRYSQGEWYSLNALKLTAYNPKEEKLIPIPNFTLYSNADFESIRSAYLQLEKNTLGMSPPEEIRNSYLKLKNVLLQGYLTIAGTSSQEAYGKNLTYPSIARLKAETIYYTVPFLNVIITLYAIGVFCFVLTKVLQNYYFRWVGIFLIGLAFCLHTFLLALRCYILQRPPVSNMFETVLYVPWMGVLASFVIFTIFKNTSVLVSSATVSLILLIVLKLTGISHSLENVQAVLDSQYWLIIHVLMVVGSYGFFCLAGLLGHFYIIGCFIKRSETDYLKMTIRSLLQALYMGLALLIAGTLLGGVWAAQSWGRFWDWDPKESWAFISACVYLVIVHSFTFHHIGNFGLALGSIIGLQMISFTWYGVNYILGTGLHSYGFGSGGEGYYYIFLLCEAGFTLGALLYKHTRVQSR